MIDLEELKRLDRIATAGEWVVEERTVYGLQPIGRWANGKEIEANRFSAHVQGYVDHRGGFTPDVELVANAALIAAARNALPELLRELTAAREALRRIAAADIAHDDSGTGVIMDAYYMRQIARGEA